MLIFFNVYINLRGFKIIFRVRPMIYSHSQQSIIGKIDRRESSDVTATTVGDR